MRKIPKTHGRRLVKEVDVPNKLLIAEGHLLLRGLKLECKKPRGAARNINPFEANAVVQPPETTSDIYVTTSGNYTVNFSKRQLILLTKNEQIVISNIIPVDVRVYHDFELENRIFYRLNCQRIDENNDIENIEYEGDIKEIINKMKGTGWVLSPKYLELGMLALIDAMMKNGNGKVTKGIYRQGVFWNGTSLSLVKLP